MNTISDHMIEGGCEDFAGYREMVGKINGLALAERELLDLDEMIHRSDKETL